MFTGNPQCILCSKTYRNDNIDNKPVLIHNNNRAHYMCFECYCQTTYKYKCPSCNIDNMERPQLYYNYPHLETIDAYKLCSSYSNMYNSIIDSTDPDVRSRLINSHISPSQPRNTSTSVDANILTPQTFFDWMPSEDDDMSELEDVTPPNRRLFGNGEDDSLPDHSNNISSGSSYKKYMKYKNKYLFLKQHISVNAKK